MVPTFYLNIFIVSYVRLYALEALRKYPPVPNVTRVANADYPIENTNIIIEKGTSIVCPIYPIHSDPQYYPEPDIYDPDRFLPEEVKKRHPFSFLPFGEVIFQFPHFSTPAPRSCMAPRYANLLVKVSLALMLINFEFKLDGTKTMTPLKMAPEKLVFWPSEGIFINFSRIENL